MASALTSVQDLLEENNHIAHHQNKILCELVCVNGYFSQKHVRICNENSHQNVLS